MKFWLILNAQILKDFQKKEVLICQMGKPNLVFYTKYRQPQIILKQRKLILNYS
ncbi:MAG: hypothetical protein HY951_07645 [Bacteroidia bacterium]|nr:hypothetical protein [Bacteroidia bacterium]